MNRFSSVRAAGVIGIIVGLFSLLVCRVGYLESYGRELTIGSADREHNQMVYLAAREGSIFDRNGFLLVGTTETKGLFIDPKFMQDYYQHDGHSLVEMDAAISKLAAILDRDSFELSRLLGDRATRRFVKVAENLDGSAIKSIQEMNLPGVGVAPTSSRCYPMGSLAAHFLGPTGTDGHGLDGFVKQYDKILSGTPGYQIVEKTATRLPISVDGGNYLAPIHGQTLVTTIDANLQMMAEQELRDTVEEVKAKRGEVVVMDPRTGDILALANYPTFNPQTVSESTPDVRRNNCLVGPYEPGSTFKPFIAGPAFMWHITTPTEMWTIPGVTWTTPYGRKITDVHHYGNLSTWDGLVKSSNILMSMLGERMGNAKLYRAITSFGFGHRTGVDLPGENAGKVNPLNKWSYYSTDSVSTGYEVMVTPLQLCRAFCTIANGGRLVTPRALLGTVDPSGNITTKQAPPDFDSLPRVLDEATANQMKRILCDVVIRGTATGHRSLIWNIAGKTGTAHIVDGHGYSETKFNSSFIACAPAENPKLVIVFIIHEPDKSIAHYGGAVAAPGAVKFLERSLTYMEVPSSPDLDLPPPAVANVLWDFSPKQILDRKFGAPKPGRNDE